MIAAESISEQKYEKRSYPKSAEDVAVIAEALKKNDCLLELFMDSPLGNLFNDYIKRNYLNMIQNVYKIGTKIVQYVK